MVQLGIESLLDDPGRLPGSRVGLITNPSGVTKELTSTIDRLHAHPTITLDRLFAPEHSIRGTTEAVVNVEQTTDGRTGLPVHSLSQSDGENLEGELESIDALLYDMQDIGCRYYALIRTLIRALNASAAVDTPLVVLDRPNPIAPLGAGGNLAPPVGLASDYEYTLPILHGLTIGELATYFNIREEIDAPLTVVEMGGWTHDDWFDDIELPWVLPSPNMPTVSTASIYPGTCLFEGTNLSEGRGTTKPFEMVGAPWIDAYDWAADLNDFELPGVGFRPAYFKPMFSKHERKDIEGVQVHILDRDVLEPVRVGVTMLASAFQRYPEASWLQPGDEYFIDRLVGGPTLRRTIEDAPDDDLAPELTADLLADWRAETDSFRDARDRYTRY